MADIIEPICEFESCSKMFTTKAKLKQHYIKVHKVLPKSYKSVRGDRKGFKVCPFCDELKSNLTVHVKMCVSKKLLDIKKPIAAPFQGKFFLQFFKSLNKGCFKHQAKSLFTSCVDHDTLLGIFFSDALFAFLCLCLCTLNKYIHIG